VTKTDLDPMNKTTKALKIAIATGLAAVAWWGAGRELVGFVHGDGHGLRLAGQIILALLASAGVVLWYLEPRAGGIGFGRIAAFFTLLLVGGLLGGFSDGLLGTVVMVATLAGGGVFLGYWHLRGQKQTEREARMSRAPFRPQSPGEG
jgi:hypothetical protein